MPQKGNGLPRLSKRLRTNLAIPEEDLVFLYVGGLTPGRGIELLLQAFAPGEPNRHLVFMGFGKLEGRVREYAARHSNIHLHPPVKPEEVVAYASGADVGISLIENTCLSYYYSLPNKIFEYLLAGIPVIASDFPDMLQALEKFHCGWPTPVKAEKVATLVKSIGRTEINEKKEELNRYLDNIGWENEAEKMLQVYDSLGLPGRKELA
jgi:glycosyltransferase involved in cell wall biosynthesis